MNKIYGATPLKFFIGSRHVVLYTQVYEQKFRAQMLLMTLLARTNVILGKLISSET